MAADSAVVVAVAAVAVVVVAAVVVVDWEQFGAVLRNWSSGRIQTWTLRDC